MALARAPALVAVVRRARPAARRAVVAVQQLLDSRPRPLLALRVDPDEWRAELPLIEEWVAGLGDRLPSQLADELATLRARVDQA